MKTLVGCHLPVILFPRKASDIDTLLPIYINFFQHFRRYQKKCFQFLYVDSLFFNRLNKVFLFYVPYENIFIKVYLTIFYGSYHFQDIKGSNGINTQNFYFFIQFFSFRFFMKFPACIFSNIFDLTLVACKIKWVKGSQKTQNDNFIKKKIEVRFVCIFFPIEFL